MHARHHFQSSNSGDYIAPPPSPRDSLDEPHTPRARARSGSRNIPYLPPSHPPSPKERKPISISGRKFIIISVISLLILVLFHQKTLPGEGFLLFQKINDKYLLGHLNFCPSEYCWPRIYLIGAAKSGTTSLWASLRSRTRGLCTPQALDGDPKWYRKEGEYEAYSETCRVKGKYYRLEGISKRKRIEKKTTLF